jgi:hypothetical protein
MKTATTILLALALSACKGVDWKATAIEAGSAAARAALPIVSDAVNKATAPAKQPINVQP